MTTENRRMILQARMGSTRLPGKTCKKILGKELLYHHVERLRCFGLLEKYPLVIATTVNSEDDVIENLAQRLKVDVFRGPVEDVNLRFIQAAEKFGVDVIIRLQGDDPLVDPEGIKECCRVHYGSNYDITTSAHRNGWILGTAVEIYELTALIRGYEITKEIDPDLLQRDFITFNPKEFRIKKVCPPKYEQRTDVFLTVDYQEDFETISDILSHFISNGKGYRFTNRDIIDLIGRGEIKLKNSHLHEPFGE